MLSMISDMLSVIYAECRISYCYTECHYADCRGVLSRDSQRNIVQIQSFNCKIGRFAFNYINFLSHVQPQLKLKTLISLKLFWLHHHNCLSLSHKRRIRRVVVPDAIKRFWLQFVTLCIKLVRLFVPKTSSLTYLT
jgi:hypothetical protein